MVTEHPKEGDPKHCSLCAKRACIYCHGTGFHGDEFTGGESYCACQFGNALKESETTRVQ